MSIADRSVTLSHGRTRYLEAGDGPPVILLHGVGFTADRESWLPNIEPLAKSLRVLAVDQVGWGLSDRLDLEYSFAYLVDFVREFQDALGLEKSHVVGHSMGGWVASLLAYESPGRVDRLVLVASGGTLTRPLPQMVDFQPPTAEVLRRRIETTFKGSAVDVDALLAHQLEAAAQPGAVESYRKILRHMTDPVTRQRYNTLRRLPFVRAPTLAIWGRDDDVNPLEAGETIARLIPGATLTVIDACGHSVPSEAPERFNELVERFLTSASA